MLPPDRILVTGAAGFVGSWLCRRLVEEGRPVMGLLRHQPGPESLFARLGLADKVELIGADDADGFDRLQDFAPTTVVNLAGSSQVAVARADPAAAFRANTAFVWELLDGLRQLDRPPAIVHASTEMVYGAGHADAFREADHLEPLAPYAASKAAAEIVMRSYGATYSIPVVIVRFGNIYGPGDPNQTRLIPDLTRAFAAKRAPQLREGRSIRSYLHVEDAVDALLHLSASARRDGVRSEVFNVAGGQPFTNLDVAMLAREASGRSDIDIVVGQMPGSSVQVASIAKIRNALDWQPRIGLAEGLRRIMQQEARP